ncbi:GNAT family N-acetyltransferase [Aestuariispira insulae]|uniref:Acetyltransferase (GNAT) family protein n=1 Tax=Aestuariispira insulae TaxID=1461337 RepID=A0A3D9HSH4_9PROT|nr:GNAT family N-acetyltransferase [Aestuariispira insulae]RED52410.1 acetyltransferase (GNAT) family protein [Aestuariispira insulae]
MTAHFRLDGLTPQDIGDLMKLTAAVGWDFTRDEWWTMFVAGRVIGHRNDKDFAVSSAAVLPYGPDFAVIGGVIVDPKRQGRGLGRQVMERAITLLPEEETATYGLVATDEGARLYEKLGFIEDSLLWKAFMDGPMDEAPCEPDGHEIREQLAMKDLNNFIKLDAKLFGHPRAEFIKRRFGQSPERAFLYTMDGDLVGYALGVTREDLMIIGPVSAPNPELALALIKSVGSRHSGRLRIDIPHRHKQLITDCVDEGFSHHSDCPVMKKGPGKVSKGWKNYYALAAQAYL